MYQNQPGSTSNHETNFPEVAMPPRSTVAGGASDASNANHQSSVIAQTTPGGVPLYISSRTTRRTFVKTLAAAGAGLVLPARSWARVAGANGRLNVVSVGTGGKGWSDLTATAASPSVDIVALC